MNSSLSTLLTLLEPFRTIAELPARERIEIFPLASPQKDTPNVTVEEYGPREVVSSG
jgi:hypothetical protein